MEEFKSFDQLPGGSYQSEPEIETSKRKKIETPADMLEVMRPHLKEMENLDYTKFFELAIKTTGVMSEALEKVVIPLPLFQKTFMEYFKLKGSVGKDIFNEWFNKVVGRGEVGFYSPSKKLPILLYINREEE